MSIFLMPTLYDEDDYGISVQFVGLENSNFEKLEVSLDGENFYEVKQNQDNPIYSNSYSFSGLQEGMYYTIMGRITQNGETNLISIKFASQTHQEVSEPGTQATGGQTTQKHDIQRMAVVN